jgi:hypothetical protein
MKSAISSNPQSAAFAVLAGMKKHPKPDSVIISGNGWVAGMEAEVEGYWLELPYSNIQ